MIMVIAYITLSILLCWARQWLDKDSHNLQASVTLGQGMPDSSIQNKLIIKYKLFSKEETFQWPQHFDILNYIVTMKEGRRRLSEELIAKLQLNGIYRKPTKYLGKLYSLDSVFNREKPVTQDLVLLSKICRKK